MKNVNNLKIEIYMPIYIDDELSNYEISDHGKCINVKTNKEVKPWTGKKGKRIYLDLFHKGKKYTKQLSRWMAMAFLELPDGLTYEIADADHKDENPLHNHINNIQWLSKYDNSKKSNLPENKKYTGEACTNSKLNKDKVRSIFNDVLYNNISYSEVVKKYNISNSTLCDILNGRTWKPVYNEYDMTNYLNKKRNSFTHDQINLIKEYSINGYSSSEIASLIGVENNKRMRQRISNFM